MFTNYHNFVTTSGHALLDPETTIRPRLDQEATIRHVGVATVPPSEIDLTRRQPFVMTAVRRFGLTRHPLDSGYLLRKSDMSDHRNDGFG